MYTIFSKDNCKWCVLAKKLMKKNNMAFEERNVPYSVSKEEFIEITEEYSTRPTVPKIFKGKELIGGYEDLQEYIENGLGGFGEGSL